MNFLERKQHTKDSLKMEHQKSARVNITTSFEINNTKFQSRNEQECAYQWMKSTFAEKRSDE